MQNFSISPQEMVTSFWRNRSLIGALVKREIIGRYRGSYLGLLWSFFNPVFMLAVYTFVFSFVFKAKWNVESESKVEFALALFSGLIIFNIFSDCISRAPTLITSNTNYVKKVVFPLEILPWISIGSALFHALISLTVWIAAYSIFFGKPHIAIITLPLTAIPLILFISGLCWFLASLGTFLRDISQVIGVIVTTMLFLSPIFYPATVLPEEYRQLLYMNPLTPAIESARNAMFWGILPDYKLLGIYTLTATTIAWLGFAWFQKTRKGFADVL